VTRALDIQTPAWALPLLQPARYKGAWGGRGGGKSEFFAGLLVENMVADPNYSVLCVRQTQNSLADSVKRIIELIIEKHDLGDLFDVQRSTILRRGGSGIITFVGMQDHTADSIKSYANYDVAFVEEAQALSQRSLDLLRPTIRKPGSELWFAWNPSKPGDPIDVLLRCATPPRDSVVVEVNWHQNPWFPDVLRQEMEYDRTRDPDKYRHVWLGEYESASEASIFKHGVHWVVLPNGDLEPPSNAPLLYGADWGFSPDPSALVRCWIDGKKMFVDAESVALGVLPDDMPTFFMSMPDVMRHTIVADSENNQMIAHMRGKGFKVVGAVKGKNSVKAGLDFLKGYTIHVSPSCKVLIEELARYSFKINPDIIDPHTRRPMITSDPDEKAFHPHVIHALRYATEAVRRGMGERPSAPVVMPTVTSRFNTATRR
jgi:phage terminase large subunit